MQPITGQQELITAAARAAEGYGEDEGSRFAAVWRTAHPLYRTAFERQGKGDAGRGSTAVYLTTAEVARLLRERLKREFPAVKFSVRSEVYAGGSSVYIRWQGGPLEAAVDTIGHEYTFAGFDGMIDMQYYCRRWLLPDGSLVFAATRGTEGSRGTVAAARADKPHPDAVLVAGGPDYVNAYRSSP